MIISNKKIIITYIFTFVFAILLGTIFHSTTERYQYKLIDLLFKFNKNSCSVSELIGAKSLSREVIRDDNVVETRDSWVENYTDLQICPKSTAFLLIDTWDLKEEKNDIVRNTNNKIMIETILPVIESHRKKGGLVIHSLHGGKSYPNSINTKTDINLSQTSILPQKLQTIILFWTLKSRGIDTVIYAGFSTNMCLWSRAHGIHYTKKFQPYMDRFLLKEGTSTWEFSENNPNFTENLIKFIEWKEISTIEKKYFN